MASTPRTHRLGSSEADPLPGRELVTFVATVEAASMHGAADALSLTQSAVSKRVQALERRVGTALLERSRMGVRPTAAGRLLYPEAKQALASLERAARVAAVASGEASRALRLAASHTIGEFLLPGWLATFRMGQDLQVQVDVINSPGVLAEVRGGAVDIGFVEGNDLLAELDAVTLLRDQLVVAVAAEHRWAHRSTLAPEELADEPYFARERDSGTRAVIAERLAHHGVALTPALETPSIQALKRAVVSGGWTAISEVSIRAEVRAGTLATLRLRDVDLRRELRAVRRPLPSLAGASLRLWEWLEQAVKVGALAT